MQSIIGENLPYTEKNPFTVTLDNNALLRLAAVAVALIVFSSLVSVFVAKRFA